MLESVLETQTKSILNTNGYNTVRRLGKGGFGHVLLATKSTSSTTCFAVKCISKKKMIKDQQLKRFLLQEINTMAILNHPNIVKLLKTFEGSLCLIQKEIGISWFWSIATWATSTITSQNLLTAHFLSKNLLSSSNRY